MLCGGWVLCGWWDWMLCEGGCPVVDGIGRYVVDGVLGGVWLGCYVVYGWSVMLCMIGVLCCV